MFPSYRYTPSIPSIFITNIQAHTQHITIVYDILAIMLVYLIDEIQACVFGFRNDYKY